MTTPELQNKNITDERLKKTIGDILTGIRTNYFTAMLGDPGSNRAQSVFSNLKEKVEKEKIPGQDGTLWRCIQIRPGISPIENLAAALTAPDVLLPKGEVSTKFRQQVEQSLRTKSSALIHLQQTIKEQFRQPFNLLILIDHFDDIFELLPDNKSLQEDRLLFVNLILTASLWEDAPIYVAVSLSPDFISQSFKYGGLGQALQEGSYFSKQLSLSDYLEKAEVEFRNEALKNNLVSDLKAEQSVEALDFKWHFLIRALKTLKEHKTRDEQSIMEAYRETGGLHGVVNFTAEKLYGTLSEKEQKISERIIKACSQTSKESVISKLVTLAHLMSLNKETKERPNLRELTQLIQKYKSAGLLEIIEPTQKVMGQESFLEKTLVKPVDSLVLNLWPRAVRWAKEESLSGFNYQNIVKHAIHNNGQVNDKDLLNVAELESAKQLFEVENVTEAWAAQYYALKISALKNTEQKPLDGLNKDHEKPFPENWANLYNNTLELAKKYVEKSRQKIDNEKKQAREKEQLINKLSRRAAIIGVVLALIAMIFWIKAERNKANLMQQNFITVLSDAHLINIDFNQRTEVLNEKTIKTSEDVIKYFEDNEIIPHNKDKIVKTAFFSIFDLQEALTQDDDEIENAVIGNAERLLQKLAEAQEKENQYYYYALKAHYDNLLMLKNYDKTNAYNNKEGFRTLQANPVNNDQFAYINKFGKIYIIEKSSILQKGVNYEKIASVKLSEDAYALAFSPDGKKLYAGTITGKLHSWNVADMTINTAPGNPIKNVKEKIYHLKIIGDDHQIFATTKYKLLNFKPSSQIIEFDTQGENKFKLGEINSLAVSPEDMDMKYLAIGGSEKTLIFHLANSSKYKQGTQPLVLKHPFDINTAMDIDGENDLAIGTMQGKIYWFNLPQLPEVSEYDINKIIPDPISLNDRQITSLDFITRNNQSFLAYANIYGQVKLTNKDILDDETNGLELIGHEGPVWKIVFNNEDELMSMEDNNILFWKTSVEGLDSELRNLID